MTTDLMLVKATFTDAECISSLVNNAYRGQDGWTRETEIVKGDRISTEHIKELIQNPNANMFMAMLDGTVAACICVEEKDKQTCIGTFAVCPEFQNQGIGKKVLKLAEEYAVTQLGSKKLMLAVIAQRQELISFYVRRGYRRTGQISEYPVHLNVGVPLVEGLTIEYLEKFT